MHLTERTIDSLPIPQKPQTASVYDDEVPAFGVRTTYHGGRSYFIRYRTRAGASRYYTIGKTSVLKLAEARTRARAVLAQVAAGGDPAGDLDELRKEQTIAQVWVEFLAWIEQHRKPLTVRNYKSVYRRHVEPEFGTAKLREVTADLVERFHLRRASTPNQANKAVVIVGLIYRHAQRLGWIAKGPLPFRVDRYPGRRRKRRLDIEEVQKVLWGLDHFETTAQQFPNMVRLLLLTGCRLSEWRDARWGWVDERAALLRLPDSKTGPKDVHLPAQALAILRSLPKTSIYVLPGRFGGPMRGAHHTWNRFRKEIGVPDIRLHDLRRTVGSMALEQGLTVREVADLLGHSDTRSTEVYLSGLQARRADNAERVAAAVFHLPTQAKSAR